MEAIPLKANLRTETGAGPARRLRAGGGVPAVLYGRGLDTVVLAVDAHELATRLAHRQAEGAIVTLDIEGADTDEAHALVRELQRHPVSRQPLAVDFLRISLTERITVPVPIRLAGHAVGVDEGGVLDHILWQVDVSVLPLEVPEALEVDVSGLNIGQSVRVTDIPVPEGVEILNDHDATVATVVAPSKIEEPVEEVPEEIEPEEGEEVEEGAEAAEGAEEEQEQQEEE